MDLRERLRLAVFLLIFILVAGTAGYMFIENWTVLDSLYMTVNTQS